MPGGVARDLGDRAIVHEHDVPRRHEAADRIDHSADGTPLIVNRYYDEDAHTGSEAKSRNRSTILLYRGWDPKTGPVHHHYLSGCASSKLLRPRNQGLTLRLNSGPKTAKLRRYARRCYLPRLTWRPCHSGDVSAPRRLGVGERRFAAASDGAEERAPTPTTRRPGTGFLGCSSRFVARVGEPPAHRPRGHRGPLASRPIPTVVHRQNCSAHEIKDLRSA